MIFRVFGLFSIRSVQPKIHFRQNRSENAWHNLLPSIWWYYIFLRLYPKPFFLQFFWLSSWTRVGRSNPLRTRRAKAILVCETPRDGQKGQYSQTFSEEQSLDPNVVNHPKFNKTLQYRHGSDFGWVQVWVVTDRRVQYIDQLWSSSITYGQ